MGSRLLDELVFCLLRRHLAGVLGLWAFLDLALVPFLDFLVVF